MEGSVHNDSVFDSVSNSQHVNIEYNLSWQNDCYKLKSSRDHLKTFIQMRELVLFMGHKPACVQKRKWQNRVECQVNRARLQSNSQKISS